MTDLATDAVKAAYPARYYAVYDTTAPQPTIVRGWCDSWAMSDLSGVPPAADMIPISEANWLDTEAFRLPVGRGVLDGKIIDYTPPPTPVPLRTQAENALSAARVTVYNHYGILNEPTPDVWVAYLKTLMAMANGSDTTSDTLPTAPTI